MRQIAPPERSRFIPSVTSSGAVLVHPEPFHANEHERLNGRRVALARFQFEQSVVFGGHGPGGNPSHDRSNA
ncbi:MAG: hypothetical protein U0792_04615 [Gemmataceae bacterium]